MYNKILYCTYNILKLINRLRMIKIKILKVYVAKLFTNIQMSVGIHRFEYSSLKTLNLRLNYIQAQNFI